jgi:hypothetical protein
MNDFCKKVYYLIEKEAPFISELIRNSSVTKRILSKMLRALELQEFPSYKFFFWYGGDRSLRIKSYDRDWIEIAPLPIQPNQIDGSCFIFTQTFLESDAIPWKIKLKALKPWHKTDYFDSDHKGADLTPQIIITKKGPILFNNFIEYLKQIENKIEEDGSISTDGGGRGVRP